MDCDVIKVPARVSLTVAASVAGELESKGPFGKYFDICENDIYFGQKTFEQAESELMRRTVSVSFKPMLCHRAFSGRIQNTSARALRSVQHGGRIDRLGVLAYRLRSGRTCHCMHVFTFRGE